MKKIIKCDILLLRILLKENSYSVIDINGEIKKYIDLRILRKRVSKQVPFSAQVRSL